MVTLRSKILQTEIFVNFRAVKADHDFAADVYNRHALLAGAAYHVAGGK